MTARRLKVLGHDELVVTAQACRDCDLYKHATQAVMGEGPTPAPLMLVGEQPGDKEDLEGRPFVGPAGQLLDRALEDAEIPRDEVYVTNVVKHFKFEPRGKRRIHAKPNATEIHACSQWIEREIAIVKPEVIVCLGATAAQLFLGRSFRITTGRGELVDGGRWAPHILATYHPSALLRMKRDPKAFERAEREFLLDLAEASSALRRAERRQRRTMARGADVALG